MSSPDPKKKRPDDLQDMILDLNFVPSWAKKEPGIVEHAPRRPDRGARRSRDDRGRQGRSSHGRGDSRGRGSGGPGGKRDGAGGGADSRGGDGRRGGSRSGAPGGRGRVNEPRPSRIPVRVDFIPVKDRLSKVVKLVRQSKRAFLLEEIAQRFMDDPRFFQVKFTVNDHGEGKSFQLYQCKTSGMLFTDRSACEKHALAACLDVHFTREDREIDPPSGHFTSVARCRRTGEILGPPNHHSYAAASERLRSTQFANLSPEAFKKQIENVQDEALVEAWKKQLSVQAFFTEKDGETAISQKEAEAIIRAGPLESEVLELRKGISSGLVALNGQDAQLLRLTQGVLERERVHPKSILLALRPAFKHMHLYLFKAGGKNFVTGVTPQALDDQNVVEEIREVLAHLSDHPGSNRKQLLDVLRPDKDVKSEASRSLLTSLRWLVEKGHVIEFFDGSIAVPR